MKGNLTNNILKAVSKVSDLKVWAIKFLDTHLVEQKRINRVQNWLVGSLGWLINPTSNVPVFYSLEIGRTRTNWSMKYTTSQD